MLIRQIVDDNLAQYAFVIGCQQTGEAIVIDPERDVDRYIDLAAREGLRLVAAAETHIHADFLSGSRELAARIPGLRLYLSDEGDADWKYEWPQQDGAHVTWLHDGDSFRVGNIELRAWHTPGHTPEHLSFVVTDRGGGASEPIGALTGDFVFVGDLGRPDLLESAAGVTGAMEPAARRLYASSRAFLDLPDYLQVWPGHGAGSACGKALGAVPMTTVGYERRRSPALAASDRGERPFIDYILADQPEPPLYFATMKRLNKTGPPVLGQLPAPDRLTASELQRRARDPQVQVIDTRADRSAFFAAHVPRSLYAPLNRAFPTIVGSLADPAHPLILIVEEDASLDEAVRALVRIGYDRIEGWAPASVISDLRAAGEPLASIESIDMDTFEQRRVQGQSVVLDVRGAAEHAARHVPGAVNVAHTRLRARRDAIDNEHAVFVHCASGARAAASAAFLAREGVPVVHVDGPFSAWQPAGEAAAG